jgi:hypothetical protein
MKISVLAFHRNVRRLPSYTRKPTHAAEEQSQSRRQMVQFEYPPRDIRRIQTANRPSVELVRYHFVGISELFHRVNEPF